MAFRIFRNGPGGEGVVPKSHHFHSHQTYFLHSQLAVQALLYQLYEKMSYVGEQNFALEPKNDGIASKISIFRF